MDFGNLGSILELSLVGTARCAVRAASSGTTPRVKIMPSFRPLRGIGNVSPLPCAGA